MIVSVDLVVNLSIRLVVNILQYLTYYNITLVKKVMIVDRTNYLVMTYLLHNLSSLSSLIQYVLSGLLREHGYLISKMTSKMISVIQYILHNHKTLIEIYYYIVTIYYKNMKKSL